MPAPSEEAAGCTTIAVAFSRSMSLTRRQLFAGLAAGATAAAQFRPGNGPKARTTPAICLYSQVLIKMPYDELGQVLRTLGVDGCDLTVMPGGHVAPEQSAVDLMRAIEAITGVGLDVPVITTAYTSLADPTIRNVVAIAGEMGVPLFRAGPLEAIRRPGRSRRGWRKCSATCRDWRRSRAPSIWRWRSKTWPGRTSARPSGTPIMLIRGLDARNSRLRFRYRACGGGGRGRRVVGGAAAGAAAHQDGDRARFRLEQGRERRVEAHAVPAGRGHGAIGPSCFRRWRACGSRARSRCRWSTSRRTSSRPSATISISSGSRWRRRMARSAELSRLRRVWPWRSSAPSTRSVRSASIPAWRGTTTFPLPARLPGKDRVGAGAADVSAASRSALQPAARDSTAACPTGARAAPVGRRTIPAPTGISPPRCAG